MDTAERLRQYELLHCMIEAAADHDTKEDAAAFVVYEILDLFDGKSPGFPDFELPRGHNLAHEFECYQEHRAELIYPSWDDHA